MKENVKAKMDETHVKAEELCWEMVGGNTENVYQEGAWE